MSQKLRELRAQRKKRIDAARAISEAAETETRDMTDEEISLFDGHMDAAENLRSQIARTERLIEEERQLGEIQEEEERTLRRDEPPTEEQRANALMQTFGNALRTGRIEGDGSEEFRDLQQNVATDGGYLVAPQAFVNQIIQNIDDAVYIRSRANVIQMPMAHSVGVPTRDSDVDDADWTTELQTGSKDDGLKFGKREMVPHALAKRVLVSELLMRNSVLSPTQIVGERLAYKFGVTQEKAFLLGTGDKQPLGLMVASDDGISTARDVSEDNTATAIKADNLIAQKYNLKAGYWNRADWMFHRDAMKQIAKLKDSDGQYLWRESLRDGEPDRLLGRPVMISEFMPNTFTTGKYVGILGDFSNYWIAESLGLQVKRLMELYAESNQIGFIGRMELDGAPVLEEAFSRVKLG